MRKSLSVLALLLAITLTTYAQSTQKGDFIANLNSENWTLNAGSGMRTHIVFVKFSTPYTEAPSVLLSLTGYDGKAGKDGNSSVLLKAENITRDGFVIKIATWGDSRVVGVEGSWLAFGKQ
ncbi:MAG: H-type lectin domain-containing protein [Bacteroidota bacterium]